MSPESATTSEWPLPFGLVKSAASPTGAGVTGVPGTPVESVSTSAIMRPPPRTVRDRALPPKSTERIPNTLHPRYSRTELMRSLNLREFYTNVEQKNLVPLCSASARIGCSDPKQLLLVSCERHRPLSALGGQSHYPVDLPRQFHIELGHAALVMCRQPEVDTVPNVGDFRMVVDLLGMHRNAGEKGERF